MNRLEAGPHVPWEALRCSELVIEQAGILPDDIVGKSVIEIVKVRVRREFRTIEIYAVIGHTAFHPPRLRGGRSADQPGIMTAKRIGPGPDHRERIIDR